MVKYVCINKTKLYNVGGETTIKVGDIIEKFLEHMVYFNNELFYTGHIGNDNLETNFITLAEWREIQINKILEND